MQSSFLIPQSVTSEGQLASLHLSRDSSLPVVLSTAATNAQDEGYAEGVVTNTKFGSFPHTTLIGVAWGSQIKASNVDTGSRGRREQHGSKKRKSEAISKDSPLTDAGGSTLKEATTASSGFIHILPPTPENWTTSLPHRTQVVYTPDYSYILHRIRARPGLRLIEAGSGSGSFTHAAARAVFNGIPTATDNVTDEVTGNGGEQFGKVFTYEFHPERHEKVLIEMRQHGLTPVVRATHRDVYKDGFLLKDDTDDVLSPKANAVFLDLPAPWEALPHLSRNPDNGTPSAVDPSTPTHICTFSPCIEQVQKTVSALRRLGWLEIEMVEMQHKRLEVRREFTGLKYEGMRSVNAMAVDVDEAVSKLREIEQRAKEFHGTADESAKAARSQNQSHQTHQHKQLDASKSLYKEGRVIHRSEPDLKTHTSYLVFAILPREWTEEDEEKARGSLINGTSAIPQIAKSQRQLKKDARTKKRNAAEARKSVGDATGPMDVK